MFRARFERSPKENRQCTRGIRVSRGTRVPNGLKIIKQNIEIIYNSCKIMSLETAETGRSDCGHAFVTRGWSVRHSSVPPGRKQNRGYTRNNCETNNYYMDVFATDSSARLMSTNTHTRCLLVSRNERAARDKRVGGPPRGRFAKRVRG